MGEVNKVVPIDKSSTILSDLLGIILFGETNIIGGIVGGMIGFTRNKK